jgi:hypothetical protein
MLQELLGWNKNIQSNVVNEYKPTPSPKTSKLYNVYSRQNTEKLPQHQGYWPNDTEDEESDDEPLTEKCLVLDLDETLLHTYMNFSERPYADEFDALNIMKKPDCLDIRRRCYAISLYDDGGKRGEGHKSVYWGIKRPYLHDFLITCFTYFKKVAVWSAGQKDYVQEVCDVLFQDLYPPAVTYSRDECDEQRELSEKPLLRMINEFPDDMGFYNTLVLDDRETTFSYHNPRNAILIPEYKPEPTVQSLRQEDHRLKELTQWLLSEEVINAPDVRKLDKTKIFR